MAGDAASPMRTAVVGTPVGVRIPLYHRLFWRARLRHKLACLTADDRPIVVGPWHSEVGFEILYWIPFLRRIQEVNGIGRERLHVISRGGVASWYGNLSDSYVETFDYWTPDEFRERNAARKARTGREKQDDVSHDERMLIAQVRAGRAHHLHPMFMYQVLAPYWTGQAPYTLADRHLTFDRITAPELPDGLRLPEDFIAVKFYFNPSFPDTLANRRYAADAIAGLARKRPVVLLTTGFRVDEHDEVLVDSKYVTSIADQLVPRNNLEVQTAVVARARAFVGTYGGFSYVPTFVGVPSYSFYSDPSKFNPRHLDVMTAASLELGVPYSAAPLEDFQRLEDAIAVTG
jgi:hypothetical protein